MDVEESGGKNATEKNNEGSRKKGTGSPVHRREVNGWRKGEETEGSRIVVWGGAEKKRRIISGTMNEAKKNDWQPAQRKNLNGGKNATERNNPHIMRDNRRNGRAKIREKGTTEARATMREKCTERTAEPCPNSIRTQ